MSDKNRNMNDINDQKTAEQQAFSEEIRRRLAEPGSGKPTLDEFKVMVYKDREKRRKKRNALVACIVAAFIVGYLTYDDLVPEVGADKNPKETIQTEDGVIIEDGGYGSSEEEDNVWVTEDWKQVADAKKLFKGLLIPKYIPNGFDFRRLEVETVGTETMLYEFYFIDANDVQLEIEGFVYSEGEGRVQISNSSKKVESSKGNIYFHEKENKATIQIENGSFINIWGNVTEDEFIKIVEGMEF